MTASNSVGNDSGNDYFNCLIEILSPGELLRPLVLEDIKKGEYVPETRNKAIAGVFNNLEIMGKRGTGFLRIREVEKKGSITNKEYQKLNNTTKRTATRDLRELAGKGMLKATGSGKRDLKYVLTQKMTQKMTQKS